MKQIIDRKVYDTETAEQLHYWFNGCFAGDYKRREKTLYRTSKGALFIHHEGGAMTDCARSVGDNTRAGGEYLEPVSVEDAVAFLASHGGTEVVLEHFAEHVDEA